VIRVFVTDDHELLREGIKKVLNEEPGMAVHGEARTAAETLGKVRHGQFDVIVLDLGLPDRNGLDIIDELKRRDNKVSVLVLSMHPEDQLAERAFAAGADGYVTKETVSNNLVQAIQTVASGRKYVSPALAELLARRAGSPKQQSPHEALSDREYEVFVRIGGGESVAKIAQECSLSLSTVYTYRTRIFQKMGLESDAEIIHYTLKNKLIE
jgi:two-component system, NarL family, invasion response regulator UvrY